MCTVTCSVAGRVLLGGRGLGAGRQADTHSHRQACRQAMLPEGCCAVLCCAVMHVAGWLRPAVILVEKLLKAGILTDRQASRKAGRYTFSLTGRQAGTHYLRQAF